MSKPYYETEEYSEAENELDTYDDPVKLVMEYRVSEKHKDQQISELQKQLEEKERKNEKLKNDYEQLNLSTGYYISDLKEEVEEVEEVNKKLKNQLKTQPAEIVKKIKEKVLKICKTEIKTLENGYSTLYCDRPSVITILDDILKDYGGKDE